MSSNHLQREQQRESRQRELLRESPFRRARRDIHLSDYFDGSRIPSPSPKNGVKPRRSFGSTKQSRSGHESTPRRTSAEEGRADDERGMAAVYSPATTRTRTPSPRGNRYRRPSIASPLSDVSSPPGELLETYQRINDADDLADLVAQDEDEFDLPAQPLYAQRTARRVSPISRARVSRRKSADDHGVALDYRPDNTDTSLRTKFARHAVDEQRLKRLTKRDSPVLGRNKYGLKAALSADNLQRRNEQEQQREPEQIDLEPAWNVSIPKTWGTKGKAPRELLSHVQRRKEETPLEDGLENAQLHEWDPEPDFTVESMQISNSPPVRRSIQAQNEDRDRLVRKGSRAERGREETRPTQNQMLQEPHPENPGEELPNTPVVVYRTGSGPGRDTSRVRADSRDLLRKLARKESPRTSPDNTKQTPKPDPVKVEDSILYAKTPVVTGAWIDTPMTGKAAEVPENRTKELESPSVKKSEPQADSGTSSETKEEDISMPKSDTDAAAGKATAASTQGKLKDKSEQQKTKLMPKSPRSRPQLEKPKLPKSGLEEALEEARASGDALGLGDDTISSLQDILDGVPDVLKLEKDNMTPEKEDSVQDPVEELTAAASKTDAAVLDRLNQKLQSLMQSIHEAQHGLSSLERQVHHDSVMFHPPNQPTKVQRQHHHHPLRPGSHEDEPACDVCGRSGDSRVYMALPRLWRRNAAGRLRPSRLTYFLLSVFIWYVAECTTCDIYCMPRFASSCRGRPCLDRNAPRFPFALPTMLWRWSHLSYIVTPLWTVLVALFRFFAQLFGLWDGFFDAPSPTLAHTTASATLYSNTFTPSPVRSQPFQAPSQEWGPDLSMADDLVL